MKKLVFSRRVLIGVMAILVASSLPSVAIQSQFPTVVITPAGMPITISEPASRGELDITIVEYSVLNSSRHTVKQVCLSVITLTATGNPMVEDAVCDNRLVKPNLAVRGRISLKRPYDAQNQTHLLVTKVLTSNGVWQASVDRSLTLNTLDKGILQNTVKPKFEANTFLTAQDQNEILELMLNSILQDGAKLQRLGNKEPVVLQTSEGNQRPLRVDASRVLQLSSNEIQKLADMKGKILYLEVGQFETEGTVAHASVTARSRVSKSTPSHVPYGFAFSYRLKKQRGNWVIMDSNSYALG